MDELVLRITRNELLSRLQVLHQEMVARNDHGDAFLLDLAIQAIRQGRPVMVGSVGGACGGGGGVRAGV
jgi:hypothetical protein